MAEHGHGELGRPRNTLDKVVPFDSPIKSESAAKQVERQAKAYNGGDTSPENFFLNVVDGQGDGKWMLQVREKAKRNDPGENSIEIDFGTPNETQVRTNNKVDAILTLDALQGELSPASADVSSLESLINHAQSSLFADISEAEKAELVSNVGLQGEEATQFLQALLQMGQENNHEPAEEPVEAPLQAPPKKSILTSFKTAIVGALGRNKTEIITKDAFGKEVKRVLKSRDVFEVEQEAYANLRLTESKNKWDPKSMEGLNGWQRFGKRAERFFDRTWRGMATEGLHKTKEKAHGEKLSLAVGIEGAISEEFHDVIDKMARTKIDAERNTKAKKIFGNFKDFLQEFVGHERDLHVYQETAALELKAQYDNDPADPENPLYHLVNRDVAAREELAARINENTLEILTETRKGDKKVDSIKLEGEKGLKVDKFLKEHVLALAIDDIVSQKEAGGNTPVTRISEKVRRELDLRLQDYFHSNEFQAWRDSLPADKQAYFENSFTYASDMLLQTEEVMLPAIVDNLEHYKGAERLNFEIELTLGTAQLSANTEETKDSLFSKERASLNQKLWDSLRRDVHDRDTEHSNLYASSAVRNGVRRERMLSVMDAVIKNEIFGSLVGLAAGKGVATAARAGMSWLPYVGSGAVAGTLAGLKEWARLGTMRSTFGFATANGLEFPSAQNAVKSAELRATDYHRIEMGHRIQQFVIAAEKLARGNYDNNTILLATAYIADSGARLKLDNERNINILAGSKETAEGRATYNRELRIHTKAKAAATAKLTQILSDDTRRGEIASLLGIPAAQAVDARSIINLLQESQYRNLLSGTVASDELKARLERIDPELMRTKAESINARDEAFNTYRWGSSVKIGVKSGLVAGLASLGLGTLFHHHEQVTVSGVEEHSIPLINHLQPLHVSQVPHGQITDPTGTVVAKLFSHVPAGTELVQDTTNPHAYDLISTDTHEVFVNDMTFSVDGTINTTHDIVEQLANHHLSVDYTSQAAVHWGEAGTASTTHLTEGAIDLRVGDLEGYETEGWWGWFKHSLGEGSSVAPRNPEINAVLKTFRGFELWEKNSSNVVIVEEPGIPHRVVHYKDLADELFGDKKDVVSAAQGSNAVFEDIPPLWSTSAGHHAIARVFDEAEQMAKSGQPFATEVHRIVYEAGISGEHGIPDANETKILMDYFKQMASEGTNTDITPRDLWLTALEDTTKIVPATPDTLFNQDVPDWWTGLVAVGYHHPLEAPNYKPLRRSIDRSAYYYGYPGASIEMSESDYNIRKSPRLNSNPLAKLNQKQEIDWYLETMKGEEKQTVRELEAQKDNIINNEVEAVVFIPLYKESENIERTLDQYAKQVDKDGNSMKKKMEILLYNNYTGDTPPDDTKEVVTRYMQSHPDLRVVFLDHGYPVKATMGRIRKDVTNYALSQIAKSGSTKEIVLVSNDGDVADLNEKYIFNGLQQFSEHTELDAINGKMDFPESVYSKIPTLFAEQRAWQFLDSIVKNKLNSGIPELTGANTMYRASILAGIGGYNEKSHLGEDLEIGWMIKNDRNRAEGSIVYDNKVVLRTNPRRAVVEWMKGRGVVDRYATFTSNEEVYENKWNELINGEGIPYDREVLQVSLDKIRNQLYGWVKEKDSTQFDKYFARAMNFLGVNYVIENDKVVITDDTKLREGLTKVVTPNLLP